MLVACGAPVQDERETIALALCEQKATCIDPSVDVVACANETKPTLGAQCTDEQARQCSIALQACFVIYEASSACAPCR